MEVYVGLVHRNTSSFIWGRNLNQPYFNLVLPYGIFLQKCDMTVVVKLSA